MQLLLLEDDRELASSLVRGLSRAGYTVQHAATCPEALACIERERIDLAVLDLMVPGGSGYDVLAALRATASSLPVVILTARDRVSERVDGLGRGADDYLVKPFAFAELAARLDAVLRRPAQRVEPLYVGGVVIDPLYRRVRADGESVELTRIEFDLLLALVGQRGAVRTRRQLLESVWGYRFDPGTNVVEVHVARLRRKLEAAGSGALIRTVRGVGYVVD